MASISFRKNCFKCAVYHDVENRDLIGDFDLKIDLIFKNAQKSIFSRKNAFFRDFLPFFDIF